MASVAAAPALQAAGAANPILLHTRAESPPVWCDNSTIVYAVTFSTDDSHEYSIAVQKVPDGEPTELFHDMGWGVPYQCIDGHVLYWKAEASECGDAANALGRQAVYVTDMNGDRALLACGAAVALLSPDENVLAVVTSPLWIGKWHLMSAGVSLLAAEGETPIIVDLSTKRDLLNILLADGRSFTADYRLHGPDPHSMQYEYALGNGAIRWLSNNKLAVSMLNLDSGEMQVHVVELEPRTGAVIAADHLTVGTRGYPIFDISTSGRLYAWSTSDRLITVQKCSLLDRGLSCASLALGSLLNKAKAGMAANFGADVDFLDDNSMWFMADTGNAECLMRLDLNTGEHECLIEDTHLMIISSNDNRKRLAISPDRRWLAYVGPKNVGWDGGSDLMLVPLPN